VEEKEERGEIGVSLLRPYAQVRDSGYYKRKEVVTKPVSLSSQRMNGVAISKMEKIL